MSKSETIISWFLLAVTFALCCLNFYAEEKMLAARLDKEGFLSMKSPWYPCIYYGTGCENVQRISIGDVFRDVVVHVHTSITGKHEGI